MVNLARDCIDIFVQWRSASQIQLAGDYRADICSDETCPAGASETESDDTPSESLRPKETEIGNSQKHRKATEAIDFEHEGAFIHSETIDSVNAGDASNGENDSVITALIQTVKAETI